jgi:succinoglycan biosynthesis protein ExoA
MTLSDKQIHKEIISVICPTYNEVKYIESILTFFINAEPVEKELLIIDGGSNDGTRETVIEWSKMYPNIYLLENKKKNVPSALNIGVINSKGKIIVRIDAHCKYGGDYFEKILETFKNNDADIVGGPTRIATETNFQVAVGKVVSSRFGIGGSKVHDFNYKGYSDHVTFGAWKREIFDEVGLFDERLIRNQDDEFHYRAKSVGKKIYLNPEIRLYYYPRSNLKNIFSQYFQYGYYKPLVLKKVKSEIKLRHIIPAIFVLYIILLVIFINNSIITIPILIYLVISLIYSFKGKEKPKVKFLCFFIYPIVHISYGIGFLLGLKNYHNFK